MDLSHEQLRDLIKGMRAAYSRNENVMAFAREHMSSVGDEGKGGNSRIATLVAYDLQAGTYVSGVLKNPEHNKAWCQQLAQLISPLLSQSGTLLEVGAGEATTLAGVLSTLEDKVKMAYGFDLSWSRIAVAKDWLLEKGQQASLFVGDLFHIPLADNSVDVVYTSHSLEPNGGLEREAINECLRVSREAVVLVEPIYELASAEAQVRMRTHGYVRGLKAAAESLNAIVSRYGLLKILANPLNPSGVVLLRKNAHSASVSVGGKNIWRCPLTGVELRDKGEYLVAPEFGLAYPKLKGTPMLRPEHAIVASHSTAYD